MHNFSNDAREGNAAHPLAEPQLEDAAFDELTDLFLGDDDTPPAGRGTSPRLAAETQVRALVVGHLPVAAAPWVSQHARDLADAVKSPVALLSSSSGHASLTVFGLDRSAAAASSGSVDEAIDTAHKHGVTHWLIRTDALAELGLAEHSRISGVTLLTSADEAALVNAYRAVKALTATAPGCEPALRELHVAVLGSPHAQARLAAEKLRKAAESFLDTGLTTVMLTEKVSVGTGVRLFDGSVDLSTDELVSRIPERTAPRPEAPRTPAGHPLAAPSSQDHATPALRLSHGDTGQASRIGPAPKPQRAPEREPAAIPHAQPTGTWDAGDRALHENPPQTIAAVRPQVDTQQHASHSAASGLAELLGLIPLEPRCPYADEVELAADSEGRAHLIVHAPGAAHSIPGALESLEIARTWLAAHLSILAAASGHAIRISPPRDPAAHLVVDHAASVRRLLDASVHMYVLAEGRSETLCVPLN